MANTKVLHIVNGDSDYSAVDYEEARESGKIIPEELWEQSWEKQEQLAYNDGEFMFDYKALKFGDVDPEFIKFIRNDVYFRDDWENNNFYII